VGRIANVMAENYKKNSEAAQAIELRDAFGHQMGWSSIARRGHAEAHYSPTEATNHIGNVLRPSKSCSL